uniref:Uncharacterized protein n=1 Tax=Catharus ustulatus TaxID=91951 RepID=A0A8C3V3H9_CATUS
HTSESLQSRSTICVCGSVQALSNGHGREGSAPSRCQAATHARVGGSADGTAGQHQPWRFCSPGANIPMSRGRKENKVWGISRAQGGPWVFPRGPEPSEPRDCKCVLYINSSQAPRLGRAGVGPTLSRAEAQLTPPHPHLSGDFTPSSHYPPTLKDVKIIILTWREGKGE